MKLLEASVLEIYETYFKDKLPLEEFLQLLAIDPTAQLGESPQVSKKGKYTDWILKQYLKLGTTEKKRFLFEDANLIRQGLTIFNSLTASKVGMNALQNYLQQNNFSVKNIGDILSYSPEIIKHLGVTFQNQDISAIITPKEKQIEVIINDSVMFVCIPKTHEAARKYGTGTSWCTATSNPFYFNRYTAEGPLYIIIDKTNPSDNKWQYHRESKQLADKYDYMVSKSQLITTWYSLGPEYADAIDRLALYFEKDLGFSEWSFNRIFARKKKALSLFIKRYLNKYPLDSLIHLKFNKKLIVDSTTNSIKAITTDKKYSFLGMLINTLTYYDSMIEVIHTLVYNYGFYTHYEDLISLAKDYSPYTLLIFQYNEDILPRFIHNITYNENIDTLIHLLINSEALDSINVIITEAKKLSLEQRILIIKNLMTYAEQINEYLTKDNQSDETFAQFIKLLLPEWPHNGLNALKKVKEAYQLPDVSWEQLDPLNQQQYKAFQSRFDSPLEELYGYLYRIFKEKPLLKLTHIKKFFFDDITLEQFYRKQLRIDKIDEVVNYVYSSSANMQFYNKYKLQPFNQYGTPAEIKYTQQRILVEKIMNRCGTSKIKALISNQNKKITDQMESLINVKSITHLIRPWEGFDFTNDTAEFSSMGEWLSLYSLINIAHIWLEDKLSFKFTTQSSSINIFPEIAIPLHYLEESSIIKDIYNETKELLLQLFNNVFKFVLFEEFCLIFLGIDSSRFSFTAIENHLSSILKNTPLTYSKYLQNKKVFSDDTNIKYHMLITIRSMLVRIMEATPKESLEANPKYQQTLDLLNKTIEEFPK